MDGTTTSGGAAGEHWGNQAPIAEEPQLLATAVGDICANCASRLANDQRYCVECGERRGKPRYALPAPTATVSSVKQPARVRRPRGAVWSGNGTLALIAGVGVLLMAMGVGVLIGRSSSSSSNAPRPVYIPAPAASAPAAAGAGAAATGAAAAAASSAARRRATSTRPTTAAAKKFAKIAKTVPKTIPKKLQPAVKTVGGACSGGPGCSGGKFTGNFFGGG